MVAPPLLLFENSKHANGFKMEDPWFMVCVKNNSILSTLNLISIWNVKKEYICQGSHK